MEGPGTFEEGKGENLVNVWGEGIISKGGTASTRALFQEHVWDSPGPERSWCGWSRMKGVIGMAQKNIRSKTRPRGASKTSSVHETEELLEKSKSL